MDKNKILLVCVSTLLVVSVIFAVMKVIDKKPENNALSSAVTSSEIADGQLQTEIPAESTAAESSETSTAFVYVASASKHSSASLETSVSSDSSVTTTAEKSSSNSSAKSSSSSSSSSGRNSSSAGSGNSSSGNSSNSSSGNSNTSSGTQSSNSSSKTAAQTTAAVTTQYIPTETVPVQTEEPPAEEVTTEEVSILESVFSASGEDIDNLGNSQQLISVSSYGSYCDVNMYEKIDGTWQNVYTTYGIVGMNGVSAKSGEGDYRTPKGLFGLGFGFGTDEMYGLNIEYRQFNENCYWVDDPQSDYYNQWVESYDTSAWNSAEHLIEYPTAYHYAVVINYNTEAVRGAGSAIFLHCAVGSYTAGCVGIPEDSMYYVMNWLDSSKEPKILIY